MNAIRDFFRWLHRDPLEDLSFEQWANLLADPETELTVIGGHSTRCAIAINTFWCGDATYILATRSAS